MNLNITIIGLGKMGSALATRLHLAGMTVTIYNRTKHKMDGFKTKSCQNHLPS
ncbi:NAD(P)-binding domain-containing protein [Gammaproteobacteria bacterium]|nr:NAD(P)-binding domain-containing protein [Gammaproteobacteria bacterium]